MLIMFKTSFKYFKSNGSVGEPINEETWHWYNDHVGQKKCPVVDTWWQTETGGIMIAQLHLLRQRNQLMRHYRYREFRRIDG
jgi:acyl-coenzyme A synthetase/AMP-(fatty) acid ligase